jgi:hypothetical protein
MAPVMTRAEALEKVIASLRAELAALRAFDVEALIAATAEKEAHLGGLAAANDAGVTPELRALAEEAQTLNEQARVHVNLMAANVRRQLDRLTGTPVQVYGRKGAQPARVA